LMFLPKPRQGNQNLGTIPSIIACQSNIEPVKHAARY
jgi:hypothetical protein